MEDQKETIWLAGEELQEVIGTPPTWMMRWGSTIIAVIISILLILSWVIKYPDIISGRIVISGESVPIQINARTEGYIENIPLRENQKVEKGQVLLCFQNPAKLEDVFKLDSFVSIWESGSLPSENFVKTKYFHLGELQGYYSGFVQAIENADFKVKTGFEKENVEQTRSQIARIKNRMKTEEERRKLAEKSSAIAIAFYDKQKKLYEGKVISLIDLENAKNKEIEAQQLLKSISLGIYNSEIEIGQLEKQILDLKQGNTVVKEDRKIRIQSELMALKVGIQNWKEKYLIIAPISGTVSINNAISSNRHFLKSGEEILSIIPISNGEVTGRLTIPSKGSGKIKEGQTVNVFLDNFPYEEFGILEGRVISKSLIPKEDSYLLKVIFPNKLTSNSGKSIPYQEQMSGRADVLTEKKKLIDRFFGKLVVR
jgi:multidrug resistance efflux pump